MAREITESGPGPEKIDQVMLLLSAAEKLDNRAPDVLADMINATADFRLPNRAQLIHALLVNYADKFADVEVAAKAVRYLLEQLDSREQREMLLTGLLRDIGGKNKTLASEIATLLGLLYAEKTDDPNAARFFQLAYAQDKYNQLAFRKLAELTRIEQSPDITLEYLRIKLRENPLDLQTTLELAQYAERTQLYELAAGTYKYSADLFTFLHPGQPLPRSIYLPWSLSSYNTNRGQPTCLQITAQLQQEGRFDLLAEAIAAKAALEMGETERANQILTTAENNARRLLLEGDHSIDYAQTAWFYCFAHSNPDLAIDWANKAYAADPNSSTAAALLAYTLVKNDQPALASSLLENQQQNQIAILTQALLHLADDQNEVAFQTLRKVIDSDPGSLVAELAMNILTQNGSEYIPIFDRGFILEQLHESIGEQLIPTFIPPDMMISFQLGLRGHKFSYGTEFGATAAITNNSSEPLVISNDALVKGNIRVDAEITGDLQEEIPNLLSVRVRPSEPIGPGRSLVVPLTLETGTLKEILFTHPQAHLQIKFTAYLDPVTTKEGYTINSIPLLQPASVSAERPAVEITAGFLQNRLNSLSRGHQGQQIKTAQLFAGLLLEQIAMQQYTQPPYRCRYGEWMSPVLTSALAHALTSGNWVVKVHTMAAIKNLPLDYNLIDAASESLNEANWPARLMALHLLAETQGLNFLKVLDYTAQYDASDLVRSMAVALGAAPPVLPRTPDVATEKNPQGRPTEN